MIDNDDGRDHAVEKTPHKEETELMITLPLAPIRKDGLH
jgi:hypothetical protein